MCSSPRFLLLGLLAVAGIVLVTSCSSSESSESSTADATDQSADVVVSETESPAQSHSDSEATDSTNSAAPANGNDTENPSTSNSNDKDTDNASVADTAKVECPIGPEKGNVTIRVDSTEKDWTFEREPDSLLAEEFERRYRKYSKVYDYGRGDLNKDGVMDLVINVGPETPSQHSRFTDIIYIGCGKDRYVKASPELEIRGDYPFLDSEKKWPKLQTSNGIKYGPHATPSFYGFTRIYRFDESEGRYRFVPGSARYTEKAAKRLGIDPENPPSCPEVGTSPPFLVESEDEKTEKGDNVNVIPVSRFKYKIDWIGHLNKDNKEDIIVSIDDKKTRRVRSLALSKCEKSYYVEVCDLSVSNLGVGKRWEESYSGKYWVKLIVEEKSTVNFGRYKYRKCH